MIGNHLADRWDSDGVSIALPRFFLCCYIRLKGCDCVAAEDVRLGYLQGGHATAYIS